MLDRNGYVCHDKADEELIYFQSTGTELIGSEKKLDMEVDNHIHLYV